MNIIGRLKRLEQHQTGNYSEIFELIRNGAYYDELDERQKAEYKAYKESLGGGARDIALAELKIMLDDVPENEAFHFQLSKRELPPTEEEFKKSVAKVEAFMKEAIEEYNSPEEVAKREAAYQKRRQEGERRKQEFYNGN